MAELRVQDRIHAAAVMELDPVKRAAMFIMLNDLAVKDNAVIPVVSRSLIGAAANGLHLTLSGWDNDTRGIADWLQDPVGWLECVRAHIAKGRSSAAGNLPALAGQG